MTRRLPLYLRLMLLTVLMAACQQQPAPTPPPQPSAGQSNLVFPEIQGGNKQNAIWMTEHVVHSDPTIQAPCEAVVTVARIKVQRNQWIRWHIHDDQYNRCPGLDESAVELVFANAIFQDPDNPSNPPVAVLKPKMGPRITARVYPNAMTVPNKAYKYFVRYKALQASPDPEVDVDGDCGGCGPPGE